MDIILVVLLVCGQPDTYIVKEPGKDATYSHQTQDPDVAKSISGILSTKPIVIIHEDKRGRCA